MDIFKDQRALMIKDADEEVVIAFIHNQSDALNPLMIHTCDNLLFMLKIEQVKAIKEKCEEILLIEGGLQ